MAANPSVLLGDPHRYARSVFVNFPMDQEYKPLLDAMLFSIHGCGFQARLGLETSTSREQRIDRITRLIAECRLSIHDMSRVQLSGGLPRFNMPFECGIAYAAMKLTLPADRDVLVMVSEPLQDRQMLSDLSGTDPEYHNCEPKEVIAKVRKFLADKHSTYRPHGSEQIWQSYIAFQKALPKALRLSTRKFSIREISSFDYLNELIEHICLWHQAQQLRAEG